MTSSNVGRRVVSRRSAIKGALLGTAALPCLGCSSRARQPGAGTSTPTIGSSPFASPTLDPADRATLAEKLGQMVLVGFRGLTVEPDSPIARDLVDRNLGGTILFDTDLPLDGATRNIASPQQLRELTVQLASFATAPFIAVDQEGGSVARLSPKDGFPATFSAAQLGAVGDPATTYAAAVGIAATLANAGINLNFAPVVDVNVNPGNPIIGAFDRSFSADPEIVALHASEFVRAHHEFGILCTLKHFPGHGSSAGDSHFGFVDVTGTWSERELQPYSELIAGGFEDLVMAAHVFNATLDAEHPASLSSQTITGLLRRDLGFQGAVISDDMAMAAITENYGFEEAIDLAIRAGVDILLYGNNGPGFDEVVAFRAIDHLAQSVNEGKLSKDRIDESYRRIAALKSRLQ